MHVLMLGWEFPPFIAGGLGTACHGLTKALDRQGTRVTFVLPKVIDRSEASHVNLISPEPHTRAALAAAEPEGIASAARGATTGEPEPAGAPPGPAAPQSTDPRALFQHVRFIGIPSRLSSAYQRSVREGAVGQWRFEPGRQPRLIADDESEIDLQGADYGELLAAGAAVPHPAPPGGGAAGGSDYGGDLMSEVERFAAFSTSAARHLRFDVIHAHDWMTFPAGLTIARFTGKPLVVHIHSTEFDRSGVHVNQRVYDIERRGMHGALRIVAVSQLTKNVIVNRYGIRPEKVEVVYNGVDLEPTQGEHRVAIESRDKIVLYFGRITYQKGPEYFIAAAKRVLDVMDNVKFVVAGSGDQARNMIEMAAGMGIGHKVLFTGFLRGKDIQRVFAMADLYVMPSVSEPFGIAPLEAMGHNVPVLISKSSGVSEVLIHALKCDFWDIDEMANKIVAVLRYPPLQKTLQEHGSFEVRRITWDGAATRCHKVYAGVVAEMRQRAAALG